MRSTTKLGTKPAMKLAVQPDMGLHVFARSDRLDPADGLEEFASQMKCFIREEYGHILGEQVRVLDGPRGLERFMAKYWAGLTDEEIDEDADTQMWVVARASSGAAVHAGKRAA